MAKNNIRYIKQIKRCECGGELQHKLVLYGNKWPTLKKTFKKEFGKELEIPVGYWCPKCGACYNKNFKRERYNISKG